MSACGTNPQRPGCAHHDQRDPGRMLIEANTQTAQWPPAVEAEATRTNPTPGKSVPVDRGTFGHVNRDDAQVCRR